jgi:hypothetical protein
MIEINGKAIDLTNPASWHQPGVSITLKPGGSITTVKDGITTVVKGPIVHPADPIKDQVKSP